VAALVLGGLPLVPGVASAAPVLKYPDLETLPPRDLRIEQADVSVDGSRVMHNVLRFTNTPWNTGEGEFQLRAVVDPVTKEGPAYQRIFDDAGGFVDKLVGRVEYHDVHAHFHFDGWGKYELWTQSEYDAWVASGRTTGAPRWTSPKTTSCVLDEEPVQALSNTSPTAKYVWTGCNLASDNTLTMGLSPGWGDTYDYYRFEQWIDLDQATLSDGQYVLRSVTDEGNILWESATKSDPSRENNNEVTLPLTVAGGKLQDSAAPTGTLWINGVDNETSNTVVNHKLLGRDDVSGVDQIRVSNDGVTWSTRSYTGVDSTPQELSWDLANTTYGGSAASGPHTVYVQFHDRSGKWSSSVTDTISLVTCTVSSPTSGYAQAVLADAPVSYWRLGEACGTKVTDERAVNHGTYLNSPTLRAPSLLPADGANTAVAFDGVNDSVSIPSTSSLALGAAFSLEAWIKPSAIPAAGGWASVLSKAEAYSLQFNGPRLEFTVIQNGTRRRLQAPQGAVVAGTAYHVVATHDGATQRLYLNGSLVASAALAGAATANSNPLRIGSWDGANEWYSGTVDDVAVYNRTLTAAQVANHNSAGRSATAPVPAAPTNLTATAPGATGIDLAWKDNAVNETGYVLERSATSTFTSVTSRSFAPDVVTFSDTGLAPGTTYYYRVKATGTSGDSSWSNAVSATTVATTTVPTAPTSLVATASGTSTVDLTWTDTSSNETGFVLERSTSAAFSGATSRTLAAGTTSATETGLAPATTYYFRLKATGSGGDSGYSNTATATTASAPAPTVPAAPTGLTATATGATTVDLRWTDASTDETGFVLDRSTTSAFSTVVSRNLPAGTTATTDTGLAAATTYYYRVRAINGAGSSTPSNTASATTAAAPTTTSYQATVVADAPVSYWRLGETSGTTAVDKQALNAGTYLNGAALGRPSLLATDAADGAVGLDGINDAVRIANSRSLQVTTAFSLEAWIKPSAIPAAGGWASILSKAESYSLQFNGPLLEFTVIQNGTRQRLQAPSGTVVAGSTYHVVGTYDGATQRLYVNGAQVASRAFAGAATATTSPLAIGSWDGNGEFFSGVIDEVAVYNKVLTPAQVTKHNTTGRVAS
jgi:titin